MRRSSRGDHDGIAEQLRPVLDGSIRGDDGGELFVATHQYLREFIAGVGWELAQRG
jgi:hypothetical protein